MLQHYSPFKVAEVFKVLASLAPGRVDLGVGKAPGGLPLSTRALQALPSMTGSSGEGLGRISPCQFCTNAVKLSSQETS